MAIDFETTEPLEARIKVIGVGSGGISSINKMIQSQLVGVEFIVVDTDPQSLAHSLAHTKIKVGVESIPEIDVNSKLDIGNMFSEHSREQIREILQGADMVFLISGMGSGFGTFSVPIFANIAKEMDILTVAVVTKPFYSEGKRRMCIANAGLLALHSHTDAIITIPNQKLLSVSENKIAQVNAFCSANDIIYKTVRGITDLICIPGLIRVDFADVRTILDEAGSARVGIAESAGDTRAIYGAKKALSCPLMDEISIQNASGVLINITGGYNLELQEVDEAVTIIRDMLNDEANIVFGAILDESMDKNIRVTVITTGIGE
jgi:cell division protein FtsZ